MTSQDVRGLYERFPYPVPSAEQPLLRDLANGIALMFPRKDLEGWRILDVGSGTGHRMASLAKRYPQAVVTGLDLSARSVEIARSLIARHGIANASVSRGDLFEADFNADFDLVICTGVLHHVSDPARALRLFAHWVKPDGLLLIWLYHSYGEFYRMLDRELVQTLAKVSDGDPLELVRSLGLRLHQERYGLRTQTRGADPGVQDSHDADAFLHPLVRTSNFEEVLELFTGRGMDWVALNAINWDGGGGLADLMEVMPEHAGYLASRKIFDGLAQQAYRKLQLSNRIRALELALRPTGFSLVAGRDAAMSKLDHRLRSNAVRLQPNPTD